MKIAITALIGLGGFVLLPAATVVPCVEAAEKAEAVVAGADQGQEGLAPLCGVGAPQRPGPTNFMLAAGGAVVSLIAAMGPKFSSAITAISSLQPVRTVGSKK